MRRAALSIFFVCLAATSALAQDELLSLSEPSIPQAMKGRKEPKVGQWGGHIELQGRYSMIGGDDGAGGDWSDDFSNGLGFRTNFDFIYTFETAFSLGGFLSTGFDSFSGKGGLGDLDVYSAIIGPKMRTQFSSDFFAEAHLGFGFVTYQKVDADIGATTVELFEPTLTYAIEFGACIGYTFFIERGGQFLSSSPKGHITLGIGFARWGEPDVSQSTLPSAEPIENVFVELAIGISF